MQNGSTSSSVFFFGTKFLDKHVKKNTEKYFQVVCLLCMVKPLNSNIPESLETRFY